MKNNDWNEKYAIAKQYYAENGNLLIPSKYITKENIKIGMWISQQRKYYKEGNLSEEQIKLLQNIGMVWSVFDLQWHQYYELAKEYYCENGKLLMSQNYTTDGYNLGRWVQTQRKSYKNGKLTKEKIDLLENIGMVWSPYDVRWFEYYNLLVIYYNTYGDVLVPLRYKTVDDKKLGSWVSYQRRHYKSGELSKEKIVLLEKLGMVWDGLIDNWNEMYKVAQQYYEENQNLSISSTTLKYKNCSLGSWVVTQRKNYAQNRLTKKQILMLNEIGMEWVYSNNPDYIWDKNYNMVLDFYNKYNHLYMPINYVSNDGVKIGVWLYDQGIKYKNNKLSEYRKNKLDQLDSSWLEPSNAKSSFPEQAVLYYIKKHFPSATKYKSKQISEIDIFIPDLRVGIEYDGPAHIRTKKRDIEKSNACAEEGIKLIRIRDYQCPIINDNSYKIILKNDSFEALDEGILVLLKYLNITDAVVNIKKDYAVISDNYVKSIDVDWYNMYEKLKEYYNEHGNINVPIYYETSDGFSLGKWLSNMRSARKNPNVKGMRLNSHKIQLLEKLHIDWAPIETQWQRIYGLAKDYFNQNGNLLIKDTYIAADGTKLGRWIATQRYNYKENILTKEKIVMLEKIGMIWDVNNYLWVRSYDLAKNYYNDNGNLLIPYKYVTDDGVRLGTWVSKQRKDYKEHRLAKERIDLLEAIGMVWVLR